MSKLADRISKLERSRGNGYVAYRSLKYSPDMTVADYERLAELTLDEMVAAGEIDEHQRDQVLFVRWRAKDERKSQSSADGYQAECSEARSRS